MLATAGLAVGIGAVLTGRTEEGALAWAAATVPVVVALGVSIVRDFLRGRMGVDAIAFVSMSAALALDEPLAAVVVGIMYSGGNVLEDFARGRAEFNLRALTDRTPRTAHKLRDGGIEDIPVEQVKPGDVLLVRAGEVLPVDGQVTEESVQIDESALTGEPIPVRRSNGEILRSGTVNGGEAFRFTATAVAGESTYAGIVRLVEEAQTAKVPFIRMADRFAILLLPATLVVAGAAWAVSGDAVRALAVLVVATPCPLILAAPVALVGGVSRAARRGILMKGGAALEALARVRTAMFDKTGTLTEGGARLVDVAVAPGQSADDILRLVASLEQGSHHILAQALVAAARERRLTLAHPGEVREFRGAGMEGTVDEARIRAGSKSLILGKDAALPGWAGNAVRRAEEEHALTIFVTVGDRFEAVLLLGDEVRTDAAIALAHLRTQGIARVVMVTGDDAATAAHVGRELNVDLVRSQCEPAEKVEAIAAEAALAPTMMVGDGINDAPALAAADVGIAMGARGATASSEAADIVILVDRIDRVSEALTIARRSRGIALQSIVAGLGMSGAAMLVAAFGYLTPVAGALLQELIDVAVILNALRALGGGAVTTPGGGVAGQKPKAQARMAG